LKDKSPIFFLNLLLAALILSACGFSNANQPPAPTEVPQAALYTPQSSETAVTPLWHPQSSCDGKPLYLWRGAGTFTWRFSSPNYTEVSTLTQAEPVYSVPSDHTCGWLSVGLGEIIKDIPVEGAKSQWSGSCEAPALGSTKTIVQQIVSTVTGWEERTTGLGTLRALRVKSLNQYADGTEPGVVEVNDWYVCGYGRVYSESTNSNTDDKYVDELLSFTSPATNESHVRYILADMQLMNTSDPYRVVENEESAESLRRWEAGIRVLNIDQFERKLVNGEWQVVYRGSESPVRGTDVKLTSDAPQ
jgi:hypothetical protein